jgi:hypothetical protein
MRSQELRAGARAWRAGARARAERRARAEQVPASKLSKKAAESARRLAPGNCVIRLTGQADGLIVAGWWEPDAQGRGGRVRATISGKDMRMLKATRLPEDELDEDPEAHQGSYEEPWGGGEYAEEWTEDASMAVEWHGAEGAGVGAGEPRREGKGKKGNRRDTKESGWGGSRDTPRAGGGKVVDEAANKAALAKLLQGVRLKKA